MLQASTQTTGYLFKVIVQVHTEVQKQLSRYYFFLKDDASGLTFDVFLEGEADGGTWIAGSSRRLQSLESLPS